MEAAGTSEASPLHALNGKRVLVISHDFPPMRSPQALRAWQFVTGLAEFAAHIDVVCRQPPNGEACPALPSNVTRHSASPGPIESVVDALVGFRRARRLNAVASNEVRRAGTGELNWKGAAIRQLRQFINLAVFPDSRSLWVPAAKVCARAVIKAQAPDVALVMHEPAASLLVADEFDGAFPWIADLADPVLAPYTPKHWRRKAFALEKSVLNRANQICVSNAATVDLLIERHGQLRAPIHVFPQGHMFHDTDITPVPKDKSAPLRLCYTGRFYSFRQPDRLIEAVRSMDGVILAVAGPEPPHVLLDAARLDPARFELHGELNHTDALALQRSADVLVSVGNTGTVQTPGKLFEYFGAGRPVLHISSNSMDPQIGLVRALRRGLTCADTADAIKLCLLQLSASKKTGDLSQSFDLSYETIKDYSWPQITKRLAITLSQVSLRR